MKPPKLAPSILLVPFAFVALACPTRPIDKDAGNDTGAGGGGHGAAGAGVAGANGAAGFGAAGVAGIVGGHAGGAAGSGDGTAGSGVAGAGGTAAGAGGATAGASGAEAGSGGGAAGSSGVRDGQPCSIASDCASRACNPFYPDVDGDGYGAGPPTGFCGTTAPVGYASMNGDCCDNATNIAVAKLIHPGADFQTTSAGGICGVTWDYDCSGTVEKNRMNCASCTTDCKCAYTEYLDSDCGTNQGGASCTLAGAPTPTCQNFVGGTGPIECR